MKLSISRFESVRLMKVWTPASPTTTPPASDRSTSVLKMTRPGVVRISSPCQRYSIGSWSPTSFESRWNSTSSSFWKRLIPLTFCSFASFSTVVAERSIPE